MDGKTTTLEPLGEIAGGVTNELNNLLTMITGYAELIRAEVGAGERAHIFATEIERAGRRAGEIVATVRASPPSPSQRLTGTFIVGDLTRRRRLNPVD